MESTLKADNTLTISSIADRRGVSRSDVMAWIASGTLRAVRFGSKWRISEKAFLEFETANPRSTQ